MDLGNALRLQVLLERRQVLRQRSAAVARLRRFGGRADADLDAFGLPLQIRELLASRGFVRAAGGDLADVAVAVAILGVGRPSFKEQPVGAVLAHGDHLGPQLTPAAPPTGEALTLPLDDFGFLRHGLGERLPEYGPHRSLTPSANLLSKWFGHVGN
jgi:hypothetical protein